MSTIAPQNYDILDINEIIDTIKNPEKLSSIDPDKLKCVASECLQAFVKFNWICNHCEYPQLPEELIKLLDQTYSDPLSYLSPNDKYIPAFERLKHLGLLCYATSLLHIFEPAESLEECLWTIRILFIKQMIIHESSNEIYQALEKNIDILKEHLSVISDTKSVIMGYTFTTQIYLWYNYVQLANQHLQKAINLSDLIIDLEGKMGKRTKYQKESKSLLNVIIKRKSDSDSVSKKPNYSINSKFAPESCNLPKNVNLMDDTLLTKVKFDDECAAPAPIVLREEEEAIVCAFISYLVTFTGSDDNLLQEEILAYLEYLIDNSSLWTVNYKCLYMRSLVEKAKSRKIERAMMQLDSLVTSAKEKSCRECSWKLHMFYPVMTKPIWMVEKVLADILFSMGSVKTALKFYKDLGLWEEMVNCYCRLDRQDKAEAIVRKELEQGKTPYLLCILGDVTKNEKYYHQAWELSSHKNSRSQKSLGDWHFFKKEYSEAIPFYVKSLDINSTIYSAWSRLAYAALTTEDYPLSAKAYRRVLEFEVDNFEAWNNLSKAYIKMGDKKRAFKTLQEAIKCSYDEWRIWENYLLVSIDIGEFDHVIRAWHRLIDIKGSYEDDQVIEILINSILADIEFGEGEKTSSLSKKAVQLLGRIVATSPGTAKVWKVYAKLLLSDEDESIDKIVNCLVKSHQLCMKQISWEKNFSKIYEFLQNCNDLSDFYLNIFDKCDDDDKRNRFLSAFRLSLRSFLTIVERNQNYWETSEKCSAIEELVKHLKEQYKIFCAKLGLED